MRRGWVIAIVAGGLAGACVDLQAFSCSDDAQCTSGGRDGTCEATGFCSYPDEECESGRRYGDLAGGLAGQCTTAVGTTGGSDSGTESSPSGSGVLTLEGTSSTSGDESTSVGIDLPTPVCGNGIVEGDEECDALDSVDGDGCNTDCVRSGSPIWSAVVASDAGGEDRLFGLTKLVDDDVMATGFVQAATRDVILVRYTVDGQEVARVVHDVDGGNDEAEAVAQGGTGLVYVCGRATIGGAGRPWVGRWQAELEPVEPDYEGEVPSDSDMELQVLGHCHDIVYVESPQIVAVGGDGGSAWTYVFSDGNLDGGQRTVLWSDGDTDSRFKEVVRAPDASVYVAGQLSAAGVVFQPTPPTNLVLPPLVSTGNTVVELQSMVVTDDTILVGGLLRAVAGYDDLWLAAYELDGDERWYYASDLGGIDEVEDVAMDPAGNVYAIGHVVSANNPNRWVGKLDPGGELVWERYDYANSDGPDRGRSIEVLVDENDGSLSLMVVAEFTNENGDLDGWIARLAP